MANISGTNTIGGIRMAARAALELVPRLPVKLLAMPAFGTRARRVAGIDWNDRDAGCRGLVADKLPKLGEGPTLHARSLRLASRGPLPDASEVFAGNRGVRVFSLGDDPLADDVVLVPPVSRFFLPDLVKLPLGALGAGLLASSPDASVLGSDTVHSCAEKFSPSLVVAKFFTPMSTPMKSTGSIDMPSGTSTVTSRNHLPSLRSIRSICPLAWVNCSA